MGQKLTRSYVLKMIIGIKELAFGKLCSRGRHSWDKVLPHQEPCIFWDTNFTLLNTVNTLINNLIIMLEMSVKRCQDTLHYSKNFQDCRSYTKKMCHQNMEDVALNDDQAKVYPHHN